MTKKQTLPSLLKDNYTPPDKLEHTSDGSLLKLISTGNEGHVYEYLNGEKKGKTVTYTTEYLKQQLNNYFSER